MFHILNCKLQKKKKKGGKVIPSEYLLVRQNLAHPSPANPGARR